MALFDADFVPTSDFIMKSIKHFYIVNDDGKLVQNQDLALVQCQWGHLNAWSSPLTTSQSLWIDDHHSVQMVWRSRIWSFVNFTGKNLV